MFLPKPFFCFGYACLSDIVKIICVGGVGVCSIGQFFLQYFGKFNLNCSFAVLWYSPNLWDAVFQPFGLY